MNEKKLLIATIVLGAMLPISAFGLSFITEGFIILGAFCGIGAVLCLIIYLDLKAGKKPKLIPMGIGMAFFGLAFLDIAEVHLYFCIPICVLYIIIGLIVLAKGIKDWYISKRNSGPKVKKPLNKKIYTGIGLIVGGYIAVFILFNINPLLMSIGMVIIMVGLVTLGCGIAQRKEETPSYKTDGGTVQRNIGYCARCGRNLSYLDTASVVEIDGEKYCSDCKEAIERDIKNQHTVCSVCGVDLPFENMHIIDDALLCHSCFLKKYGDIIFYYEDETGQNDDYENADI